MKLEILVHHVLCERCEIYRVVEYRPTDIFGLLQIAAQRLLIITGVYTDLSLSPGTRLQAYVVDIKKIAHLLIVRPSDTVQ